MARMELPVLEKFCFIFDLRKGCMVMGIINSILTFILAVILITFAVDLNNGSDGKKDEVDAPYTVVHAFAVFLVVLLMIKFLLDLVSSYAVYKEKTGILKKYCLFWKVFLVLFIISFLKTLSQMEAGLVIAQLLFVGENFYHIMVIRSFLISINEEQ